ncbi:MAG: hypothetical protein MEQ07_05230 [Aquimonas sp.]|nr:hypothetical protein [Aquimonas sp.]
MSRLRLLQTAPLALALSSLLLAPALQAQTPILADQPASGRLDAGSPRADDGTPYQLYEYTGRPGERLRIRMESNDFDSYLAVGSVAAPGCSDDCSVDDDSGGGLNAALAYSVPASGKVQIRANSINSAAVGDYTLSVTVAPPPAPARPQALRLDTDVEGRLGDSSARDTEDRPHDLWTVSGRRGQSVQVRLDSDDFDAFVEYGRIERNQFVSQASDDDSGPGLNARLMVTLDASGRGVVKVTSPSGSAAGSYRLRVGDPLPQREIVAQTVPVGESVRGQLDENDPFDDEEARFDVFRIEGRPGQRVVARLQSESFDPTLKWGLFEGETFLQEAFDDDSGGGTTAQLSLTLDEDGVGRLLAVGLMGGQGGYTLSVVAAPRPAQAER